MPSKITGTQQWEEKLRMEGMSTTDKTDIIVVW